MAQKALGPALKQLKDRNKLIGAEIGVYFGTNASYYLEELDIESVFLIDPYTGYENYDPVKVGLISLEVAEGIAHHQLLKYKQKIMWIKKKASEAAGLIADDSLDFVYIDGNHSHDSVTEDILLYYPKLKKDGLLSGHDYDYESIKKAVDGFAGSHGLAIHTKDTGELGGKKKYDWWIWKGQ